ncbi:Alpha/Beta hydrolase protein [Hysterangium stoloniferum]|nr:Alpha/Beta hydrolase protein [Hysterangium stoloniferum]
MQKLLVFISCISSAALASQTPFAMSSTHALLNATFKEGPDIFSPKNLIELSRPGAGVANDIGDLAFIPVTKFSFKEKTTEARVYVAPLQENPASNGGFLSLSAGDAFWLDARTLGHVVPTKDGKIQEIYAVSVKYDDGVVTSGSSTLVGSFPTCGLSNFKYNAKGAALVFSVYVWPDTNLTSIKQQDDAYESRGTTALVYDRTYVRHWDTWRGPKTQTLFTVGLAKENGTWALGGNYLSPLQGTGHSTPVEPFGGTDHFDVSSTHIVYTVKDPFVPEAWHTRQNIYIVPLKGGVAPKHLTSGKQGATGSPVFNPQGTKVAWTEMAKDGYEADRSKIIVYDLIKDIRFTLTPTWDRSASQLTFSADGNSIIFTADENARTKIWIIAVPNTPKFSDAELSLPDPIALTQAHSASSVQPLPGGRVLYTQSSLTSPNDVYLLSGLDTPERPLKFEQITRLTENELQGKDLFPGEDIWFEGEDAGRQVHSFVFRPKGYRKADRAAKKWPVIFIVHGGPQSATADSWSTRWNPNVFAQQGYFVITPNPTGSTSFGQEFTDRITEHWGDRPFEDLKRAWKAALELYPEIDTDNAVAAGASWGGYAMNWIQGHPEFGFGFKAIVCHDGVFDTKYNGFSTEELYFFNHDFGGPPWTERSSIVSEKWNPSNFVHKFSTPQLLFHGSRDYRLPETESLGVFNALQQLGIDSRLVIFPDENHWVLKPENSLKWHEEIFAWFTKHTNQ